MNVIIFDPRISTIYHFMPTYENETEEFVFEAEEEYQLWFTNNPACHANWVIKNSNKSKKKVSVGALIDPNLIKVTQYLKCNHSGTKAESSKNIKVGCLAALVVKFFNGSKVIVVYNWRHNNHNPLEISEISCSWLSEEACIWINEHIEKNLDWKVIKELLRLEDIKLEEMENSRSMTSIPFAMMIQKELPTIFDTYNSVGHLLVSWVSPWQKKFLENAEEWYLDSTPKTCKSFLDNKDCYLMSVVVYNPLKDTNSLKVKRIMIDCSLIEQKAIWDIFGSSVQILLCYWYIKHAWESHIKKVTIPNTHLETKNVWTNICAALNLIMHSNNEADYNAHWQKFRLDYDIQFPVLMTYMEVTWEPKKKSWVKTWRQDALAERDYYQDTLEIYFDIKSFRLSVADTEQKRKANVIAIKRANGLVEEVELQELQAYKLTTHLHDCSCSDSARLCKHIFLVSRVFNLPVTVRQNVVLDSAALFGLGKNNGNIISEDNIALLQNQMSKDEQRANLLLMNESLERIWKQVYISSKTFEQKEVLLDLVKKVNSVVNPNNGLRKQT
ncbi:hypothetical protein F4703DRAFT_1931587 [Phycomyces blakesleeanus]